MIEETALRFSGRRGAIAFLDPVVIANAAHADLVSELLEQGGITPAAVVLEPQGRNTAATAALAALVAAEIDPEAYVLLAPADHLVSKPERFLDAIELASAVVADKIVTFGIAPSGPETGYGYIRQGEGLAEGLYSVEAFTEKPNVAAATKYVQDGRHSWNSGVFFFSPAVLLEEFAISASDISDGAREALSRASRTGNTILLDAESFARVRSEAVDRAVMEKTKRAAVAPCEIGWADVGSWAELWRLSDKDALGNVMSGPVCLGDSSNTLIRSDGMQISAIGVSDLVVVASGNSILIMPRSRAQDVKQVIPS